MSGSGRHAIGPKEIIADMSYQPPRAENPDDSDAPYNQPGDYLPPSWGDEQMDRAEDQWTRWRDGY